MRASAQSPSPRSDLIDFPLETQETIGTFEFTARQSITWNRRTGAISWDEFEIATPDEVTFSLAPGTYLPEAEEPQKFEFVLGVNDGRIVGSPVRRPDGTWLAPLTVELAPRNARWEDPPIILQGITVDSDFTIDSALGGESVPFVEQMLVRQIRADSVQAGIYEVDALLIEGSWNRPAWRIDELAGQAFGGAVFIEGQGTWGTEEPAQVSLDVEVDGVDVQAMLKAFNIPRADQIQGRVRGRAALQAEGRDWRVLEMDMEGVEGTVYLHRKLLYDMLGSWLGILTEEQMRETLVSAFGDREMIPFERLSLGGALTPETLSMRMPLENEVMDILIEPRIERELLWDIYDRLIEAGLKNLQGVELAPSGAAQQ